MYNPVRIFVRERFLKRKVRLVFLLRWRVIGHLAVVCRRGNIFVFLFDPPPPPLFFMAVAWSLAMAEVGGGGGSCVFILACWYVKSSEEA